MDKAELREVIELLVDAMRRADPDYVESHDCDPCSDEDWDTAIEAGENALEQLDSEDETDERNSVRQH